MDDDATTGRAVPGLHAQPAAVRTAPLSPAVHDVLVRDLFAAARVAVTEVAAANDLDLADLATTLAVVLCHDGNLWAAQIGDGVVVARSLGQQPASAAEPMRGEFANESTFLTSGTCLPSFDVTAIVSTQVDAFAISSDGLRLLVTENSSTGAPYSPFFQDAFASVADGATSAAIEDFLVRVEDRTGDDKSLIVGVRGGTG
jgi:hypothetical protein